MWIQTDEKRTAGHFILNYAEILIKIVVDMHIGASLPPPPPTTSCVRSDDMYLKYDPYTRDSGHYEYFPYVLKLLQQKFTQNYTVSRNFQMSLFHSAPDR